MEGYHHLSASPRSVNHIVTPQQPQQPQPQQPQQQQQQQQQAQQTNNDVISLHYMELEEFLLENAVAVAQQQQQQQQQEQPVKGRLVCLLSHLPAYTGLCNQSSPRVSVVLRH